MPNQSLTATAVSVRADQLLAGDRLVLPNTDATKWVVSAQQDGGEIDVIFSDGDSVAIPPGDAVFIRPRVFDVRVDRRITFVVRGVTAGDPKAGALAGVDAVDELVRSKVWGYAGEGVTSAPGEITDIYWAEGLDDEVTVESVDPSKPVGQREAPGEPRATFHAHIPSVFIQVDADGRLIGVSSNNSAMRIEVSREGGEQPSGFLPVYPTDKRGADPIAPLHDQVLAL